MPFIDVRSSGPIAPETEKSLKEVLGEKIALIPGKSESSLMIQFSDNCRLWFGGEQEDPIVFANVMVYGSAAPEYYAKFKDAVIPVFEEKLGAKSVYLKFEEVSNWFWN